MKKLILILIANFLINFTSYAQQNQVATIYGAGVTSCGDYFNARESKNLSNIFQYEAWMDGYFTASSMYKSGFDDNSIISQKKVSLLLWLDNYCKNNPFKNFSIAVQELEIELNH